MKLSALSIIPKAADLMLLTKSGQGRDVLESIIQTSKELYPQERNPYIYSDDFTVPMHLLSPRMRAVLLADEFETRKLWDFLSAKENVIRLISATEMGNPAAEAMPYRLISYLHSIPQSLEKFVLYKQVVGYMIKVIMELFGYVVEQKKVRVNPHKNLDTGEDIRFFTTASRYRKLKDSDLSECLSEITDAANKKVFSKVFNDIRNGNTNYQRKYALDELTIF